MGFTEEEQTLILDSVKRLVNEKIKPIADDIDELGEFPWELWNWYQDMGLLGLYIPEEYGGAGVDLLTFCKVAEEVNKVSNTAAGILTAPSLGSKGILVSGNKQQKEEYLLRIAQGEIIVAFGLTEPKSGSDAASMKTTAIREGDDYIINGSKQFISNEDICDLLVLYAKTDPSKKTKGVSAFLVHKDTPGFNVVGIEKMAGGAIHATSLVFENCHVPLSNILGQEGEGFKTAMASLDEGRCVIAARSVGLAQGALDYATNYARERKQFGQPIGRFQGLQFMIADMASQIEAARRLTYFACTAVDSPSVSQHEKTKYASMAKLVATDMCMKVCTDAVQILGGYGYMLDYPVQRYFREAKLNQIVEGTNQIQRIVISREVLEI